MASVGPTHGLGTTGGEIAFNARPKIQSQSQTQESRREGWTDAAIMLCKLNKSQ